MPSGSYTVSVVVAGAEPLADHPSSGPTIYADPGQIAISVPLANLRILNAGTVNLTVNLSWSGVPADTAGIPLDVAYTFDELAEIVMDIGTDPLGAIAVSPVDIAEDIRRQVESIAIDTAVSEIVMDVTADVVTSIDITLSSGALFAGGTSNTETLLAGVVTPQQLVFPITATDIVFIDPDDPGPPPAGAVDAVALTVDTVISGYNPGSGYLTLTNIPMSGSITSTIDPAVAITVETLSITLRDVTNLLDQFAFQLTSTELDALSGLPSWLLFTSLPVRIAMSGTPDPADVPAVVLRVTGYVGATPTEVVFPAITIGDPPAVEDVASIVNLRPDTIDFAIEPDRKSVV